MTGWLIALAILLVLLGLLTAPAHVELLLFHEQGGVTIRYLFFHWHFPSKKARRKRRPGGTKKRAEKPREEKAEPEKEKEPWTGERVRAVAGLVKGLLQAAGRSGRFLLRGVHIGECQLEIMVSRADACKTAVACGQLNAVVYPLAALLQNWVKVKELYINIYPGFWSPKETVAFLLDFRLSPGRALSAVFSLLFGGVGPLMAFLKASRPTEPTPEEV